MTFPLGKLDPFTWLAANAAGRDAIGSDDSLRVGDSCLLVDTGVRYRCSSVDGADASTWVGADGDTLDIVTDRGATTANAVTTGDLQANGTLDATGKITTPVNISIGTDALIGESLEVGTTLDVVGVCTAASYVGTLPNHASTHIAGGSDALTIDAVAGTGSLRTLGTGAQQACAGNDSRLSDARAPTAHATTHNVGGSDVLAVQGQVVLTIPGDLTVDTDQCPAWSASQALTIVKVRATVKTAPTGASLIVDVHKNGTTIFTTQGNRPTITTGTYTDDSAAPDVTALADGDDITIDVDQIGSTLPGSDLTVQIFVKVAPS